MGSILGSPYSGQLPNMAIVVDTAHILRDCLQAVTEKYGAPDILVNNAGITKEPMGFGVEDIQGLCFDSIEPSVSTSSHAPPTQRKVQMSSP